MAAFLFIWLSWQNLDVLAFFCDFYDTCVCMFVMTVVFENGTSWRDFILNQYIQIFVDNISIGSSNWNQMIILLGLRLR